MLLFFFTVSAPILFNVYPINVESSKVKLERVETQRRRHQKSETGVSGAPQKGLMSSKKNLKINKKIKNKKQNWKENEV